MLRFDPARPLGATLFAVFALAASPGLGHAAEPRILFEGDTGCAFDAPVPACADAVVSAPSGVGPFARIAQDARLEFPADRFGAQTSYRVVHLYPDGSERTLVSCAVAPDEQSAGVTVPLPYRGNGGYVFRVLGWRDFRSDPRIPEPPSCPPPSERAPSFERDARYAMRAVPPAPVIRGRLLTRGLPPKRGLGFAISPMQDALNRYQTLAVPLPGNPTDAPANGLGWNPSAVLVSAPGRYALRQRALGHPRRSGSTIIDEPGPWTEPFLVTVQSQFEVATARVAAKRAGRYTLSWRLMTPEIESEAIQVKIGDCGRQVSCKPAELKRLRALPPVFPDAKRKLVVRLPRLTRGTTYGVQLVYSGRPWVPAGTITQWIRVRGTKREGRSPLFIVPQFPNSFTPNPTAQRARRHARAVAANIATPAGL